MGEMVAFRHASRLGHDWFKGDTGSLLRNEWDRDHCKQ